MKKAFRLTLISALLLGLFIPFFDFYFKLEKTDKSMTFAQESREKSIEELNRLAKKSFYTGNLESAANYYQEIISLDPFNFVSRRNLAFIYNEMGILEVENQILLKTAILSEEKKDYLDLAVSLHNLGYYISSNFILENKINEKIKDKNFLYLKYYYLIKNNLELSNFKKAESYLLEIANLKINTADLYLLNAELNKLKENYKLAFEFYSNSYQENKTQTYLFKEMALMLEKEGEELKAYNYWQKTLRYGWFKKLAYQKINYYQNKYPELKPTPEEEKQPEEINPFDLTADWQKLKPIPKNDENKYLKIGLQEKNEHLLFQYSDSFSVVHKNKIIFRGTAEKNYLLEVKKNSLYISSEDLQVKLGSSDQEYHFYSSQDQQSFYVYNINYGQGYFWQGSGNRQYRGNMIIKGNTDNFTLINKVELTPYLISVVPSEIYGSWPLEALKAQAVAARSYTLNNLDRHKADGYDLCSTVHCAAYNGVQSEYYRTTDAVIATQAVTAYFDDQIIKAVFSSNSGGITERSDQIWSADLPYLRGANQMKNNKYQFPLTPEKLKKWLITSPESYSKDYGSSNYRWQLKIPAEVIEYRSDIKNIKQIKVKQRASRGTITSLTIYGEEKDKNYSVSQIRRIFGGLKSSRFYFNSKFSEAGNLEEIYIHGSGWGHNLGLDQSASAGMGKAGWNYKEIIKHFYPGVEIRKYN